MNSLWEKLDFITKYPETGRKSAKDINIQFVNFSKNYRIYYRVDKDDTLRVLAIFDTRQDPSKRPY